MKLYVCVSLIYMYMCINVFVYVYVCAQTPLKRQPHCNFINKAIYYAYAYRSLQLPQTRMYEFECFWQVGL